MCHGCLVQQEASLAAAWLLIKGGFSSLQAAPRVDVWPKTETVHNSRKHDNKNEVK
jgi:hypothetical protein